MTCLGARTTSVLFRSSLTVLTLAVLAPSGPARAQSGAPRIDAAVRTSVIERTATALAETYVEADAGRKIGDLLRGKAADGTYERFDNPAQFADAVTRDMRSLNGDLHLGLQYSPPGTTPATFGGPGNPAAVNFGMGRVEILAGNVGYLEITGFLGAPGYRDAVIDALRFLSRTSAVIIDVRRNGGGSGEMSHFVFSHFLGADPVPTINVMRRGGEPVQSRSFGEVPGPRRVDVPLYVLTSQGTGSAAEEFSFVLRNRKRAAIVGTRTAGAGRMVTRVPVGDGFSAGISTTRVTDPVSGAEWESVGVEPHVAVDAADALDAAHEAALTRLRPAAGDPTIDRLIETIRARRTPVPTSPADLVRFAGTYDGRVVSVVDGALWYGRRPGALAERLVPLGKNRFALGAVRFSFETGASGVSLTIEQPDGTQVTFGRTASVANSGAQIPTLA
jgi:hypothetical protein